MNINEIMKLRFKVKEIPVYRPLFLRVIGVNQVEIDTTKCGGRKKLTAQDAIRAVKAICPDAELITT